MTSSIDRLYTLLPAVYRIRDAALVGPDGSPPLRELLRVVAEQVELVENDIAQLYDNGFIETCQAWVVPYIGDLIGYRPVYAFKSAFDGGAARAEARERAIVPRREVANTLGFRRRKGSAALLPELARAVADWPAVAVETYRQLAVTQSLRHVRLDRGALRDVHSGRALDRVGGAFDDSAYSVDVRRANSTATRGRHNIPEIALFAWRLYARSVTQTSACCIEDVGPNCFTFNVLGHDTQLYTRPQAGAPRCDPALAVPAPITRRAFAADPVRGQRDRAAADYYGAGKSLMIWANDWPKKGSSGAIAREAIIPSDLSAWGPPPPRNHVAVDPVLGRIVFPSNQFPKGGLRVTYHEGFSANIGGGEYDRTLTQPSGSTLLRVGANENLKSIRAALDAWAKLKVSAPAEQPLVPSVVIELTDNGVYTEPLNLNLAAGESLQLRSAGGTRAVIRLLDYMADRPDAFSIGATGSGARVVLDGLLIAGRGLQIYGRSLDPEDDASADLCEVEIRDCTLVPGWMLDCDCEPKRPNEPSVELINTGARLRIERSIVGSLLVASDEVRDEPAQIVIEDSIVDATDPERVAIGSAGSPAAYAIVQIARSTVFGETQVHALSLGENSLFVGQVFVARRQIGCVRFCYVPPGSRTPKRFHCEPDNSVARAFERAGEVTPAARARLRQVAESLAEPVFNSQRFGSPRYAQLSELCDDAIARGADDDSELGVFHDLYQPQRLSNLTTRLAESIPAGMNVGVFFAT